MPNVRVAIVNPETKQPCAITDLGEVKLNGDCICVTLIVFVTVSESTLAKKNESRKRRKFGIAKV